MKRNIVDSMDPYQILFPLGALHAVVGASTWLLFALKLMPYPGQTHAHHMLAGFLLSFVTGFLMTAVPSFTGTPRRSNLELMVAALLSVASLFTNHYLPAFLTLLFLCVFFLRRMAARAAAPPPHFIFIPMGLALGVVGSGIATFHQFNDTVRVLLFYGMMLSFLLGIGAKLISAFLGWAAAPTPLSPGQKSKRGLNKPAWPLQRGTPFIQALLLLSGLIMEVSGQVSLGRVLQALCASWIAMQEWRLYRRPQTPGKLPFWTWISAWMLIAGLWTHALAPALGVHAAHLLFIGGFGLMTLLVASRVTLAHGGHGLSLESTSRIYMITAVLALLAAFTRFIAPWTPSFIQHLAYAATFWILAVVSWCIFFVPRMFMPRMFSRGEE